MTRLLFISFTFMLTVVLGAIAFTFTALTYPGTMRQLMSGAERLRDQLSTFGLSDNYMVWVDILLQGDNLVLMGFIIVARIVMAIIGSLFNRSPRDGGSVPPAAERGGGRARSQFYRWG